MNPPAAAPGSAALGPRPLAQRGPVARAGRILVVDDDRLVLLTLSNGLRQAGFEVIDADNGDEAILLAHEHRPELALLDIRMEGLSGFDVAETLRDVYRIPFMFLSAFADEATHAKVRELGALDYLTKPVDVDRILPSVTAALARVRAGMGQPMRQPTAAVDVRLDGDAKAPGATDGFGGNVPGSVRASTRKPPASSLDSDERAADPWSDPLPLALGVLMHRHSLPRQKAWQHLQRLSREQGISPAQQAERLLAAVEELSRTAP